MGRRKRIFDAPKLKNRGGDITKKWFVEVQIRNPRSDKLIRKRFYGGINVTLDDVKATQTERYKLAANLIKSIDKKISAGWNPLADEEEKYSDLIEYKHVADTYGRIKVSKRNIRRIASNYISIKKETCKQKTFESYNSKLRKFVSWCEINKLDQCDVSALTNQHLKEFFIKIGKTLDKRTVEKYRQNLYALFNFMVENGHITSNPVHGMPIPSKKVDAAPRPIIRYDLQLLLKSIEYSDPQLYLACLFQYYTAIRPGTELRLLRIGDLDLFRGSITIIDTQSKKERHETVDMPLQLKNLCIERYLLQTFDPSFYIFGRSRTPGTEPVGKNTLRNRFNVYRDALKLPKHYKFYSMKHTGAGMFIETGATIVEVQKHLRHRNIEETQYYIERHFGQRNMRVINHFPSPT